MKPVIIGVCGGTGAGKTTLVKTLAKRLGYRDVAIIQHDRYYRDRSDLPPPDREKVNYDHPNALESSLLVEHLKQLRMGNSIEVPVYDFSTHTRKKTSEFVWPAEIIFVEGILIFAEKRLRELFDIRVFVETVDFIRLNRRIKRDLKERNRSMKSVIQQYVETVYPMHNQFVEKNKCYADLVVSGSCPIEENLNALIKHFKTIETQFGPIRP